MANAINGKKATVIKSNNKIKLCIYKVTIRPVLNGTVPFFESLSRCPLGNLRDAKMSRFQKVDKKNNENKCSLTKYCFYYILFLMCTCVFDVIDREWHLDKITRQQ